MGIADYKKAESDRVDVQKLQTNLKQFLRPILKSSIIDGVLVKDLTLVTGSPNTVKHTLGRKLQGWIVVRQRASAIIWDDQDTNMIPSSTLVLQTSANVTVDLWVF